MSLIVVGSLIGQIRVAATNIPIVLFELVDEFIDVPALGFSFWSATEAVQEIGNEEAHDEAHPYAIEEDLVIHPTAPSRRTIIGHVPLI